ncbi:hypothetical protein A3E39_01295 [Candidatus Uhrbacteria bacterium RIFCSPHIGHO2_12_FULL_60_25]|uniref:DegT/DnrJ/EryC1/StrS aminotransferase n=1 Tax=Candidatus Uhrbacteria bacterium RIFCSPHIGHO2_12_FULL_60_25 TaxID=1802399 RepID=A0A1F7UKI4_9BACT|nr:MAG: hypothetical protein A3D73_02190 [Candidatus Uhrbacteria bacterium RIFCSPHIGHO2_02_FULL_60_44]OGL78779.1 MAG: hypothetical protein A3E39_01295 [Candidatus Uhrbacteria bacterium RIFCSPHIGHO2_12_FULL_60_25]
MGDEVIVPAVTFVATSNMLIELGLTPVFVDVDRRTYNIDPSKIEAHITDRTRAIVPVHLFGQPCNMEPIEAIAKKHKLRIVEDSCETMFTRYRGRSVGSFGDIACFSTYMCHLLVTGVGGIVLTKDKNLAIILRSLANHGRDSIYFSMDDRQSAVDTDHLAEVVQRRFNFVRLGYSYRLTELEGALGVAQLDRKAEIIDGHKRTALRLLEVLRKYATELQLPYHPTDTDHAFMMFPIVILHDQYLKVDLVNHLEARGIETRDMLPLISQPFYRDRFGDLSSSYPVADWIQRNGFYIGSHQGMTEADIQYVAEAFNIFFTLYKPDR